MEECGFAMKCWLDLSDWSVSEARMSNFKIL